jgi:hypothetical protein
MNLTLGDKWAVVTFKRFGYSHTHIRRCIISSTITDQTISRLYAKYLQNGNVEDQKREGRNRSTTEEEDSTIVETGKRWRREGSPAMKKEIKTQNINVSESTIRRRLKESGSKHGFPSSEPLLSEKNRIYRIQWASKHKTHHWDNTIFSDEKIFVLGKEDGKIWMFPGQDNCRKTKKGKAKIHLWGAFSKKGKTNLVEIQGTLNQDKYVEILKKEFLPYWHQWANESVWYFMQDGASPIELKIQ